MATYYSAFFSSGLMAANDHLDASAATATSPTTPRAATEALPSPDTTPTSTDFSSASSAPSAPSAPRLRRRKSSITMNASPVTSLKTAGDRATAAVQRHTLLAP
ncbi:hypothetical protein EIP91_010332, partial [Steccherinum ochraceum]